MEHITLQEYKQLQQKGNSKYKNKKATIDGIEFDSKKESRYYQQLKLMEKQGLIKDIKLQTRFEIQPKYKKNNKTIRAINYIADFTYFDVNKGKTIIVDTKGYRTEVYKLKKKIFEYIYPDLEIREV